MQWDLANARVSRALVGVPPTGRRGNLQHRLVVSHEPPTRRQQSPWRTNRGVLSVAPSVRRDAGESDRDGRAPLLSPIVPA